ncbi:MAG TPA: methyltransferase domain-containing protein [Candidatus Aminicenantes bacterium]|nr:methyltransferase domain-containing protein [Candidatus Aminicenantes bacterium]
MNKLWQHIVVLIIRALQNYGPHEVEVIGRKYLTSKDVFNPKYFRTSEFMARHICVTPEDEVLDIGTGSGILAIVAGFKARRVLAVDINPEAVRIAQKNIKRHGLESTVRVIEGDLFSSLPSGSIFDVILINPPYLEGIPQDNLGLALYDPAKSLIKRFFKEASHYLKPDGFVQMAYSSIAEPERVLRIANELGWRFQTLAESKELFETYIIWKLTPDREK